MVTERWNIKLFEPSFAPWEPRSEASRRIAVLVSGGVDSSVAAHRLKEQGWDVLGITMKIPISCRTGSPGCCGADAALVCHELSLPHYFVDVTGPFEELIIERFRQSYAKGETPNPCVDCNTLLKFSLLWDFIEQTFGVRHLSTGHYARVIQTGGLVRLGRGRDRAKDQSYFLYGIACEKLARFVLPLGAMTKQEVRSIAFQLGLTVAEKAESMELCFAGEGDYRAVLACAGADEPGDITDMHGTKIGTHKGIANYTLGQRRGIGFAGGKPLYVGRICAQTNTIALGTREEVSFGTITADRINALIPEELVAGRPMFGKIRSYGEPQPCTLAGVGQAGLTVEFDRPQFAPCPGQRLVLYNRDDNIVAGGTISPAAIS
ncbi:MAG TPA: tRNA 2-thiouridine(34) synthase MnmA [Sedimentisphaerales bacterium]|nr:tRNA 2-thiouridine(34) synthase MnmA [Sedimentisphaerales bacterium]